MDHFINRSSRFIQKSINLLPFTCRILTERCHIRTLAKQKILPAFFCVFLKPGNGQQPVSLPTELENNPGSGIKRMDSSEQAGYSLHLLYSYTMQTPGETFSIYTFHFFLFFFFVCFFSGNFLHFMNHVTYSLVKCYTQVLRDDLFTF